MGEKRKARAGNLLGQMKKQIQTYKLISKLSNFRGLLKHLPEDTSAVSRRRSISTIIFFSSAHLLLPSDTFALLVFPPAMHSERTLYSKQTGRLSGKVDDIASFILD